MFKYTTSQQKKVGVQCKKWHLSDNQNQNLEKKKLGILNEIYAEIFNIQIC